MKKPRDKTKLGQECGSRWSLLQDSRTSWLSLWQDIADYVMTRRAGIQNLALTPSTQKESRLFDTTAAQSNIILANGQLSWLTPLGTPWFSFNPPRHLRENEEAKKWYADAAQEVQHVLASASNFYTAIHELYLDRSGFGTGALMIEQGRRNPLHFECLPIGSYAIDQDFEGQVDTVFREIELTGRQAVQKFGADNVPEPVRKAEKENNQQGLAAKRRYIHAIYPRGDKDRDSKRADGENMPIASVWFDEATKHVCREAGYHEHPAPVTRYLLWNSGTQHAYGWSPSWLALPEARQLNFLQKMMDALAEKMAFPPVLAPEELTGELRMEAGGITYFSPSIDGDHMPKEWGQQGSYDIGLQRIQERQRAIERAFHNDLFQMFARLEKHQMTAREVEERSSEKIAQFSPTFARMTTELLNPLLTRVFFVMYRAGAFGEAPEGVIVPVDETTGELAAPEVEFTGRLALAVKSLHSIGFVRTMEKTQLAAAFDPAVMDNFNFDRAARDMARDDGLPDKWLRDIDDRDQLRASRAEAQAQAAQAEQAQGAARAAKDIGQVPPDSAIGEAISKGIAKIPT